MAKADLELNVQKLQDMEEIDYSQRAQWLRAAVLGANDGLVSTASLMIGVGAVKQDVKAMILSGFAGLVAGACSMAIGEFVSVYSQLDIEVSQMKRERRKEVEDNGGSGMKVEEEVEVEEEQLPRPFQAALASALAFTVGALVPLLSAAFVRNYVVRIGVVAGVSSLALAGFGAFGAVLGGAPMCRASARVLFGGWVAMLLTFGLMKLVGSRVM